MNTNPALLLRVAVADALKMAGEPGLAEAVGEVADWIERHAMPAVVRANIAGEDLIPGAHLRRETDGLIYWNADAGELIGAAANGPRKGERVQILDWNRMHDPRAIDEVISAEILGRYSSSIAVASPVPVDGPASPGDVMARGDDGRYRRYVRSDGTTEPPSTWLRDSPAAVGPAVALRSGDGRPAPQSGRPQAPDEHAHHQHADDQLEDHRIDIRAEEPQGNADHEQDDDHLNDGLGHGAPRGDGR